MIRKLVKMERQINYGDRGENVSLLQAHLNSLGYELKVDGIFGKKTLEALNDWKGVDTINAYDLECNLKVIRQELNSNNTIGQLYINNELFCDTLEDTYRDLSKEDKVYGQTCIPYGTYEVVINNSPKYGRLMPRLLNVPHFEGILIHSGNTEKDSAGCILVGVRSGNMIINSRDTFNKLFDRLKNYSHIKIEIV